MDIIAELKNDRVKTLFIYEMWSSHNICRVNTAKYINLGHNTEDI